MGNSLLGSSSRPVYSRAQLREKRTCHLSRYEQVRLLLGELLPGVVVDIIELYGARPCIVAFDYTGARIVVFTGDWTSPPKSILIEPRLRVRLRERSVWDVCEFRGSLVFITERNFEWSATVADNQGRLQEGKISPRTVGTLVQLQGKLYSFDSNKFAVFDHHAKCFLPDTNLPPGCLGVTKVCVFKGLLYLLMLTNGPRLRLGGFDIETSKCHDEGTCQEIWASQMCANDKNIFVYGLAPKKYSGLIVTWNHDTGFTAAERVRGDLRIITCDNVYIYFTSNCNTVVVYDIATKQFTPDAAPIENAGHMGWFGVSSPKIF